VNDTKNWGAKTFHILGYFWTNLNIDHEYLQNSSRTLSFITNFPDSVPVKF